MTSSPTTHENHFQLSSEDVVRGFREAFSAGLGPQIDDYLSQAGDSRSVWLVQLVACELALRLDRGLEASVADYRKRYPELELDVGKLSELLAVELKHRAADGELNVDQLRATYPDLPVDELVAKTQSLASRVAGYEVRHKIGQGGMGTVYRARQTAIDRDVALKIIRRDKLADPSANEYFRGRFQREALAVAAINHPHVVQIFEAGEHDGNMFIAMELVEGRSLQQRLNDDGVLAPIEAAKLTIKLAHAIHEVHLRQIVHRDLKPDNILLTAAGEPKVGDFGLARPIEHAAGQTVAGWFIGTPEYASPETAGMSGSPPTPAVDIYGLGAILYATLTGRPPFARESIDVTLQRVRSEGVVAVRQLRSNCPRDLETICLKCLEKEPSRRYSSARELADDLSRFVEGRPIKARPVGWLEQTFRWCKRNPWLALAETTAAALLILATTISILRVIDADRNAAVQAQLRQQAEDRTNAAEIANGRLRSVLDSMFSFRALDYMSQQRELSDYQKEFLKSAEQYFVRATDGMTGREAEAYRASSMVRIGLIYMHLGDMGKSVPIFNEAIAVLERLDQVQPLDIEQRKSLALGYLHRAGAFQAASTQKKLSDLTRAIEFFSTIRQIKEDLDVVQNQVLAYYRRGVISSRTSAWDQALSDYSVAEELIDRLKTLGDDDATIDSLRGVVWAFRGELHSGRGDNTAADRDLTRAIAALTQCHKRTPDNSDVLQRLVLAHFLYGDMSAASNQPSAVSNYRSAADYQERLVSMRPAVTLYRRDAVTIYLGLSLHLADLSQRDEALGALDRADIHLAELDKQTPGLTVKYLQGKSFLIRCLVQARVVDWWEFLSPTPVPESVEGLNARMAFRTGLNLHNSNEHERAEQAFTHALTLQQTQFEQDPSSIQVRTDLANSHYQRASVRNDLGKHQAAIDDYSETIRILQPLVQEGHSAEDQQFTLALSHLERGLLQFDPIGDVTSAAESHQRAIEGFHELVNLKPTNLEYKLWLGGSYCNSGQTLREETPANALPHLRQAIFILNDLHQREPDWVRAASFLRNAHWHSARALDDLGRHAEALRHWDQALDLDKDDVRKMLLASRSLCRIQLRQLDLARSDAKAALEYKSLTVYYLKILARVFGRLAEQASEHHDQDVSAGIECLRRAVEEGYRDVDELIQNTDFKSLRDEQRFKQLLQSVSN